MYATREEIDKRHREFNRNHYGKCPRTGICYKLNLDSYHHGVEHGETGKHAMPEAVQEANGIEMVSYGIGYDQGFKKRLGRATT